MFCQLEYLRHCLRQRIRRALDELPETLDETYEEIGNQNWEYAHRLFQCVAAASRPLNVKELAEFLALDFDSEPTPTLRDDWREENPERAVRYICPSLLVIVEVDGSPVIQFAHFSVKEYLMSKRLSEAKETISRFHVSMTLAHMIVAQACLGVLLHIDEKITKDDLEQFPLAKYPAEHWVGHARFQGVSPKIQDGMKRLFDPDNHHLSVWVWIYDPELETGDASSECPSQARATPLHYAAFCGLHDVVKFLIVERSQNVNARGFDEEVTPLGVASQWGHTEVARVLLEHGTDTEIRDKGDWSPLERASSELGHVDIVQVLLEHGANVGALDENNQTALHIASAHGQLESARILLQHGASANARDKDKEIPLHRASNEGLARVLLQYRADPNAQNNEKKTPLHLALEEGSTQVACALLENGADANAGDSENRTPLHVASRWGYLDGVRLLLQHSADIHTRDNKGHTPFQVALAKGHDDVKQLLLDHGAEDHRML